MIFPKRVANDLSIKTAQKICFELLVELDEICQKNKISYWLDGGTLLGAIRHNGFIPWDDDIDICLLPSDYTKLLEVLYSYCKDKPNRLLYFKGTTFNYLTDFYGSTEYLVDGIFPIKIDLIPVKAIGNTSQELKVDKSLNQICAVYLVGEAKEPNAIIDEHKSLLPVGTQNIKDAKNKFISFYLEKITKDQKNADSTNSFAAYSYHDAFMRKSRPYHSVKSILPLQKIKFESASFWGPNDPNEYLTNLYSSTYMALPAPENRKTHLTAFYQNKDIISKAELIYFIEQFHIIGDFNLAINRKKRKVWVKVFRILSSCYFGLKLLVKGKFNLLIGLVRYINAHAKRF